MSVHELLAGIPGAAKLLGSAQSALPLTADVWGALAHGIGTDADGLRDLFDTLLDEGLIAGAWGEPNPLAFAGEVLEWEPAGAQESPLVRWRATCADGRRLRVRLLERKESVQGAWPATGWRKVGVPLDLAGGGEAQLLQPASERSFRDTAAPTAIKDPKVSAFARALATPVAAMPPEDFWTIIARAGASAPADARRMAAELVVARQWRRFALKLRPARLGWRGCGLVGWDLSADDAPKAAESLATLRGTGDVSVRARSAEWPATVCAVILGYEEGAGERAAKRIAQQWGREASLWIPFEFE